MKERTYTKEEIMKMFEETKELLQELYEKETDGQKDFYWSCLIGCNYTLGAFEAKIKSYENGWRE